MANARLAAPAPNDVGCADDTEVRDWPVATRAPCEPDCDRSPTANRPGPPGTAGEGTGDDRGVGAGLCAGVTGATIFLTVLVR